MKKMIVSLFVMLSCSSYAWCMDQEGDQSLRQQWENASGMECTKLDCDTWNMICATSKLHYLKQSFWAGNVLYYGGLLGGLGSCSYTLKKWITSGCAIKVPIAMKRKLNLGAIGAVIGLITACSGEFVKGRVLDNIDNSKHRKNRF